MILSGIGGLLILAGFLFGYAGIAASDTSESAYQGNLETFFVLTGLGVLLGIGGWLVHVILPLRPVQGAAALATASPPLAAPPPPPPALPPDSPPPPVAPPPVEIVAHAREEEMCEIRADQDFSDLRVEVDASESAASEYKGRIAEVKAGIEERIRTRKVYSSEDWGTAVAVAEGAAVGGSVAAGSILSTVGGSKTEKIKAEEGGHSDVQLQITAPENAKTQISAAVLTALEAQASVLDVPEDLFEDLELAAMTVAVWETLMRLVAREEWVEEFVEFFGKGLSFDEKARFLKAISAWRKELLGGIEKTVPRNAKEAAKRSKLFFKELQELVRTYGREYGRWAKITKLGKFLFTEFAAVIIEKGGGWIFRNAEVEVRVEGSMDFTIGDCTIDDSEISVEASRKLQIESGLKETGALIEPADKQFERRVVRHASGSCSAKNDLVAHIEGFVGVEGSARYEGDGYANLNSIWAVAWVVCCEHGTPSDGASYRREQYFDKKWGGWFKVPAEEREEFPSDTQLADAGAMRAYVTRLMDETLDEILEEAFGEGKSSPCDNPAVTEARLKACLAEWYKYLQEEWKLFEDSPDSVQPRTIAK